MSSQAKTRKAGRLPEPSAPKARTPKPAKTIGRPPTTPNLKAQRAKRAEKAEVKVPVTAEFIRSLDINHPGHQAYTRDGVRGWEAWKATTPRT